MSLSSSILDSQSRDKELSQQIALQRKFYQETLLACRDQTPEIHDKVKGRYAPYTKVFFIVLPVAAVVAAIALKVGLTTGLLLIALSFPIAFIFHFTLLAAVVNVSQESQKVSLEATNKLFLSKLAPLLKEKQSINIKIDGTLSGSMLDEPKEQELLH